MADKFKKQTYRVTYSEEDEVNHRVKGRASAENQGTERSEVMIFSV